MVGRGPPGHALDLEPQAEERELQEGRVERWGHCRHRYLGIQDVAVTPTCALVEEAKREDV
jgi:hypothetical protein